MVMRWCAAIALASSASSLLSDAAALTLAAPESGSRAAFVLAGYPAGVLLGCVASMGLLRLAGYRTAFALLSVLGMLAALTSGDSHTLLQILSRLLSGACMGGLYVATESCLNASATNTSRGRIMAAYIAAAQAGAGGGHLLLGLVGSSVLALAIVVISGHLAALALIPPGRGTGLQEERIGASGAQAPSGVPILGAAGCAAAGLLLGALGALAPLWGARVGLTTAEIALLLGGFAAGALTAQWPVGMLSDRAGRTQVLLGLALLGAGAGLWLMFGPSASTASAILPMALLGASSTSLYAVASAHANDVVGPAGALRTAATLMLVYSGAAWAGCMVAGLAMSLLGPGALFGYCVGTCAALSAVTLGELAHVSARRPQPQQGV
jgi:MFS family permease